jgi:hypothetical protein
MLSIRHEVLVELLRNRPDLTKDLARGRSSGIPDSPATVVSESKLTELVPTGYSADLVVLLGDRAAPAFGLVVEVQLQVDERKRYSWPLYVSALRARHRCPCCVLVITVDASVARWAAEPIHLGQPGSPFRPLILGLEDVPCVTSAEATRACPEPGVLSALAHGETRVDVGRAAFEGVKSLFAVDEDRATIYNDVVMAALGATVRAQLEAEMRAEEYEYQSEFARKHIAQGREMGREEGREEEAARAVIAVFEARDLPVPDEVRRRIEQCDDLELLALWLRRAVKATAAADIFDE